MAILNKWRIGAEIGGAFAGIKATSGGPEAGLDARKSHKRRQPIAFYWCKQIALAQGI